MARTKEFDEQIVLARARDLFWEQGYSATSIQELEKHLGISRSSLYRFFGGKRALYDRTLAIYQAENHGKLHQYLVGTDDVRQALIELFSAAAQQYYPDCVAKARGCYIVNATTEMANTCTDALGFAAGNREKVVRIFSEALASAQVQGKMEEQADPIAWAEYLFLCYNGLQVVVQTSIEREALVRAVTRSVDALPWVSGSRA